MPLAGFVLALLFDVGASEATGMLLVSMSPGGVTSTLFTSSSGAARAVGPSCPPKTKRRGARPFFQRRYWCGANVTISIVMTTLSTIVAFAAMPLLLFVYMRPPAVTHDETSRISYAAIFVTLVVATTPALLGWRIRAKSEACGTRLEKVATKVGVVLVVAALVLLFAWPSGGGNAQPTARAVAALVLLSPCGFAFGWAAATVARLDAALTRTVSIETGIQQVGIAGAIAVNSFRGDQRDRIVAVIAVFGLLTFLSGLVFAACLRTWAPLPAPASAVDDALKDDDDDDVVVVKVEEASSQADDGGDLELAGGATPPKGVIG